VPSRRDALVSARRAAGLSQEELARTVGVDRATVQRWERGVTAPQPQHRREPADALRVTLGEVDQLLGVTSGTVTSSSRPIPAATDEIDALELVRRATAGDVTTATLDLLDGAVDDLASSYATTAPAVLLDRVRAHLGYVGALLDGRATLSQRRRVMVAGAWLWLLAGTLRVDLEQQAPAVARLRAADHLAREAGHDAIRAWVLETRAWQVLTLGEFGEAVQLSQGAQRLAPAGSSIAIQATAQEGRAHARLGDARATTRTVRKVNRMACPLSTPDRPEHHYRYDPAKATSYTATTLSWIGDPAAVDHARQVIARLGPGDGHGGRPRRLAVARLDLALALVGQGEVGEAVDSTLTAITSGHVAPSNRWRAREVITAVRQAGTREFATLRDAYAAMTDGW
jgi:transcriptional regulator with XRE-family HTH domain